jgi:hypothetical protein
MFNPQEILLWCFQQNYHLDKSNAAVHCSPVRFSPITFRLYEWLLMDWVPDEDITPEMAEVKHHHGMYVEDKGRIEQSLPID